MLLNVAAVLLVLYSLSLLFLGNFNLGNLLVWLLTAAVCAWARWRAPLKAWFSAGLGRIVWWLLTAGALLYVLMLAFVACSGHSHTAAGDEKVLIVLGAGLHRDQPSTLLRCRLDAALACAQSHPDMLVVTTGGQGRDEWRPEGDAMRDYLIAGGLDPARVLAENRSTSTEENFRFARELLAARGIAADAAVAYVTNDFHCYRAGCYAALAGFRDARALPAVTPLRSLLPCYLREALAILYYWVFRRVDGGPLQGMVGLLSLSKRFFYR